MTKLFTKTLLALCISTAILGSTLIASAVSTTAPATTAEATEIQTTVSNIPVLTSIGFDNATIDGEFDSQIFNYNVTVIDNSITPTLASYEINNEDLCEVNFNYTYNESSVQTGMIFELIYESGSTKYTFNYNNVEQLAEVEINSVNTLSDIQCPYTELSPKLNDNDTSYKLYIPSDMTVLDITPVPTNPNATCQAISQLTLALDQEPTITIDCTATDGTVRSYKIKIKRTNKTTEEIKAEMASENYTTFVEGEKFYQQPLFFVVLGSIVLGFAIVYVMFKLSRRITATAYDEGEKPFYKEKEITENQTIEQISIEEIVQEEID